MLKLIGGILVAGSGVGLAVNMIADSISLLVIGLFIFSIFA